MTTSPPLPLPNEQRHPFQAQPQPHSAVPMVSSQVLLCGQKTLAIEHNGGVYLLQCTRAGKLILTK
ncbi:hemin uptake protein HemP [Hydrogenophaga sp.]|uniref:hemin uptake protein HemP n=1 Tax=Hydrogenophaga sp. TaxID=1904254 RepID=UPI0019CCB9E0|nr:hemin uptake protein HemP [Hydrogenophaga sp.]MBD3892767.1 hemin uptake protein HemP [Hydrogenophaga sp.]